MAKKKRSAKGPRKSGQAKPKAAAKKRAAGKSAAASSTTATVGAKPKKASPATKKRRVGPPKPRLPVANDPTSEDFAYTVADFAWSKGLAANSIARELWHNPGAVELMQVKRALLRAKDKFLVIRPRFSDELREELERRVPHKPNLRNTKFVVVDDNHLKYRGAVFAQAAEVAHDLIGELMTEHAPSRAKSSRDRRTASATHDSGDADSVANEPNDRDSPAVEDIVISNAGGRTVSEIVRAMQRHPPVTSADSPDESCLQFVAGNGAYLPERFDQSANFLAVTMSKIFSARHLALRITDNEDVIRQHCKRVEAAKLFICGAGNIEYGLMSHFLRDAFPHDPHPLPENAVGDLAFNLLDRDGIPVNLVDEKKDVMNTINPCLNLQRIGRFDNVLLILDDPNPDEKVDTGIACIRARVATHVVIGSSLASRIVEHMPAPSL